MTAPASIEVAKTILEQFGGRRFVAMTGAKNFTGSPNSLQFALPSYFAKNGINRVRVTLLPSDTYRVEFFKIRATKVTPISSFDGIYADGLSSVFTTETGLLTTFR